MANAVQLSMRFVAHTDLIRNTSSPDSIFLNRQHVAPTVSGAIPHVPQAGSIIGVWDSRQRMLLVRVKEVLVASNNYIVEIIDR